MRIPFSYRFLLMLIVCACLNTNGFVFSQELPKFSIEQDIMYTIQEDGTTKVDQKVSLTNQDNDVIATNYSLIVNQSDITEETAKENDKSINVIKELDEKSNTTKLKVFFNKIEIGKGAVKEFSISYKTKNLVNKIGDVWYITIPKSNISTETTLYNVKVSIPNIFGDKMFISPNPTITKTENNTIDYYFTKENLLNNGITGAFGKNQMLNFKLIYQIKNDTKLSGIYQIALPSDIKNYQQIAYSKINPEPKRIYKDTDGNVIAEYKVYSGKNIEVEVRGSVKIITQQIDVNKGGKFEDIPKSIKIKYTKSDDFWETKDKGIKELSKTLYKENTNVSENAKAIYEYITNNLKYDSQATNNQYLERKGGAKALDKNTSLACMEFTDLFITLARSMGIPAREINGYAITNDNINMPASINVKGVDLLHAWAEYYDPNFGWIQIDPTWGTTSKIDYFSKMDTNHVAFVVRGTDSKYPLPAGMYRYENNTKLINVDFSNDIKEELFKPSISIEKIFNFSIIHWLLGYERYKVTNVGNTFIYNVNKKDIGPQQSIKMFINKKTNILEIEDISGNKTLIDIKKN